MKFVWSRWDAVTGKAFGDSYYNADDADDDWKPGDDPMEGLGDLKQYDGDAGDEAGDEDGTEKNRKERKRKRIGENTGKGKRTRRGTVGLARRRSSCWTSCISWTTRTSSGTFRAGGVCGCLLNATIGWHKATVG